MPDALNVLLVEDSEDDAELLLRELKRAYTVAATRVDTAEGMREALANGAWDVVVSDYALPKFGGAAALGLLRSTGLDIPFILVSGTIGEEAAVLALKGGADDLLVKGKLARLLPAIDRLLRERKARAAHREAERALRESELRLRRLAESGIVGIAVADNAGVVSEANDAFLAMVGFSRGEIAGGTVSWERVTPPESGSFDTAAHEHIAATGAARPWETEYVHRDGNRVPVLMGMAKLDDARTIALSVDLSARKRAEEALRRVEEQFRQTQKMDAIGTLAGGVAHDFNNLLSVILSYSQMLAEDLPPGDPRRTDLEAIDLAGRRAVELTRQLLAFSRQQVLQPRIVNLNEIIVGVERMLRRLIGADVELSVIGSSTLGPTKVDPGQIEQIVMNLAVNAREAMPTGGKLTIETGNVVLDEAYAHDHPGLAPGPYVMLAITDTGLGMDKDTQARIFEPFFTTKEAGRGAGLGLATVFGIVQQSGGSIWVHSEPARGTTFKVYFPRADAPAATDPARAGGSSGEGEASDEDGDRHTIPPTSRSSTILLVEDEEAVRVLARTILRRSGYRVIDVQSGGDALLVCEQHPSPIDLLLTDVVMPRMSGPQLADRLRTTRPAMKVLFMSGYTDSSVVHHGVLDSRIAFLQKPITPETLTRKVLEVLDGTVPSSRAATR